MRKPSHVVFVHIWISFTLGFQNYSVIIEIGMEFSGRDFKQLQSFNTSWKSIYNVAQRFYAQEIPFILINCKTNLATVRIIG